MSKLHGLQEGRIVHYFSREYGDDPANQPPRAAIVTRVWDRERGCVNLTVFEDDSHIPGSATSVLFEDYAGENPSMFWRWPPRAEAPAVEPEPTA